ncbi:MAG: DinB family protein [Planctomycetota bacterium]
MTTTSETPRIIGPMLAANARPTVGLAQQLAAGIDPTQAARLPISNGKTIITNHPVFIFGHLALYPERVADLLGADKASVAVPEGYDELFRHGVDCRDDASGSLYPAFEEVRDHMVRAHTGAIELVASAGDDELGRDLPDEARRGTWPTVGVAVNFLLGSHAMFHLGQLSAWRRFSGLGPAT